MARPASTLLQLTLTCLDAPPLESAALVGLSDDRINAVQLVALCDGEAPALAAVQALRATARP